MNHLEKRGARELEIKVRCRSNAREGKGKCSREWATFPFTEQDPFPSKHDGILERDDLGLPFVPGGLEGRLGIPPG
jgi:hypothetical protein